MAYPIQNTLTGTMDIASLRANRFQSIKEYGLDTINQVLQADQDVHNAIVMDMVSGLCEVTTDAQRIYGTSAAGEMVEVDEYGRGPTQTTATGATVGFPLRLFQYAIGWTDKWMETHTPAEMAELQIAAQDAHKRAVIKSIKQAIYGSANYTFNDFLVDKVDVFVKRFLNADGSNIPNGPNGEIYDGTTHSHLNAVNGITSAAVLDNINDVVEHGYGSMVKLAISRADEASFVGVNGAGALPGFIPYVDPRLRQGTNANQTEVPLDMSRLDNRAIGIFGAAEVWVKPWAIPAYPFAWDMGAVGKPLAFRQRTQTTMQGLRVAGENSTFPLIAQFMEAEWGVGVWTRTNGGILYTGGSTYADPNIN